MGRWLDSLARGAPPVWLNDTAYSLRVLMQGAVDWMNPAAVVQWRRRALQLLGSDVAVLDVLAVARGWARSGGKRSETDLSWLHADPEFTAYAGDLIRSLRSSTGKPLALEIPSPRRWLALAPGLAADGTAEGDDLIEDIAADMARFLRLQGDAGVDAVLLYENDAPDAGSEAALACYASLVNTAKHFRWDLGIRLPRPCARPAHFEFAVAPEGATGIDLPITFWQGGDVPPPVPGGFYYAEIPEYAQPAEVLGRLKSLG